MTDETPSDTAHPEGERELLPCPFCGGEGEISWYARGKSPECAGYFVECGSCSASGEGYDIQGEMPDRDDYTKSLAIAAWNTRSTPPSRPQGEEVERLARVACDAEEEFRRQHPWSHSTLGWSEYRLAVMRHVLNTALSNQGKPSS